MNRIRRIVSCMLVVVTALVAGGCGARDDRQPRPSRPPVSRDATQQPGEAGSDLGSLELALEPIARGLHSPLWLTHTSDGSGRLFVVEQGGRIRVIKDGRLLDTPFLDISDKVRSGGERGLLGLAFSPGYAQNGNLWVDYTDLAGDTVVARLIAQDPSDDAPRFEGPDQVFTVKQPYANHNGGCIAFGPDGLLWVGMGDGGSGGDPQGNAQNPKSLLGKVLVVDVESDEPGAEREPRIRYTGVRNPWRFSFDRQTGDMWIADVGQNSYEEIDFIPAADVEKPHNLGWNLREGAHPFKDGSATSTLTEPIFEYGRVVGQSVTGGYVYRGTKYPDMQGVYLFADFSAGWIDGMRAPSAGAVPVDPHVTRLVDDAGNPASFGEDEAGELYVCDLNGTVYRLIAK